MAQLTGFRCQVSVLSATAGPTASGQIGKDTLSMVAVGSATVPIPLTAGSCFTKKPSKFMKVHTSTYPS